ncbi:MAG: flagellar motor protein [Acidobacteriota bacterium]
MAESTHRGIPPTSRLDRGTIAGLLCAVAGIIGGLVLEQGSVSDIAQATAAFIVFGGTLGAVLIGTPLRQVVAAARASRLVLYEPQHDLAGTLEQLITFATKARRHGIISLEENTGDTSDPILRRAMELAIDGVTSAELREMMELDIQAEESRGDHLAKVYETAGGYSPTIGIIGAVLGLIQVMKNLANIDAVGHGIAVAFVATVYGVGVANLLFLPAGAKIRNHSTRRIESIELIIEGVAGIVEGMNPRMLRRRLDPLVRSEGAEDPDATVAAEAASETALL